MGQKKDKTYSIIIAILIVILVISTFYWATLISEPCGVNGGCQLVGIELGPDDGYAKINLYYDAGLNNTTISKFDNDTLSLKITVLNENLSHYYHYWISDLNATFDVGRRSGMLYIMDPETDYPYNVSLQFIINSTHPDVRNATILGSNNYLNFTVMALKNWDLNVTFSDEYASYYDLVEYAQGNSSVTLQLFEPRYIPEAKYWGGYHPIEIGTSVLCA